MSGCAVSAIFNEDRKLISGKDIITSIASQRERSNGLGGGFAAYGIYPDYEDFYAFHIMFEDEEAATKTEKYLYRNFLLEKKEPIPHRHDTVIKQHPLLRRYFVQPRQIDEKTPDRSFEHLSSDVQDFQLGKEVKKFDLDDNDKQVLKKYIDNFCQYFGYDAGEVMDHKFIKLQPHTHRPYGNLYAY